VKIKLTILSFQLKEKISKNSIKNLKKVTKLTKKKHKQTESQNLMINILFIFSAILQDSFHFI